jgi:hypothetical protein
MDHDAAIELADWLQSAAHAVIIGQDNRRICYVARSIGQCNGSMWKIIIVTNVSLYTRLHWHGSDLHEISVISHQNRTVVEAS